MELSTFAYTMGIAELLFGIPLTFYCKPTLKWLDKLMKDELHMRILGAILAILGALVLIEDYRIASDPEGLIRLIAWAAFLKGMMYAWWPQTASQIKKKWLKSEAAITLCGLIATAVGVLLMYAGSIV